MYYNITLHKEFRCLLPHNLRKNTEKNIESNNPDFEEGIQCSTSETEINFVTGVDKLFSCPALIVYINVPNKLKHVIKRCV